VQQCDKQINKDGQQMTRPRRPRPEHAWLRVKASHDGQQQQPASKQRPCWDGSFFFAPARRAEPWAPGSAGRWICVPVKAVGMPVPGWRAGEAQTGALVAEYP